MGMIASMSKSPIYPGYEAWDGYESDFDPQLDFAKFLKEARNHDYERNFDVAYPNAEKVGNVKRSSEGLKSKKSWKSSLFSWLQAEKKRSKPTPTVKPSNRSHSISRQRRGYSGPMLRGGGGGGGGGEHNSRPRQPNSGPLTSLFNSKKRTDEEQIPYECLDRLNNNPHSVDSYGPVYLVT